MFCNNGYSIMQINTVGTQIARDKKREVASTWLAITIGIHLAHGLLYFLKWKYPAFIGLPTIAVCWIGVVITQVRDLFRNCPVDLTCGNTHLPLMVNSMTKNIRFKYQSNGSDSAIQIFKKKYRCREIVHEGRKAFRLTGIPSDAMASYMKLICPKTGLLVFFVKKIDVTYVVNTEGSDPIGELLAGCSKQYVTTISV